MLNVTVLWCILVRSLMESRMPRPKGRRVPVRMSVSIDGGTHATLLRLADRHDVSLAWMVRRALTEFIERQDEGNQPELPLRRSG